MKNTLVAFALVLSMVACVPAQQRRGNVIGGPIGGGFTPPTRIVTGGAGDITAVNVTGPITGGGSSGAVNISLLSCSAAQILKMNGLGTAWACDADVGVTDGDKGDVTVSASGASWVIDAAAVTLAKMANIPTQTFIGRTTALAGVPEALTATQATAMLDPFTATAKGLAPASGGGTVNYLRADGTYAAPPGAGDITGVTVTSPACAAGSFVATLTGGAASGDAPVGGACAAEVGDISAITVTAPIAGATTSGSAALSLTTCAADQIYKMIGGVWTCAADNSGGITNSAGANVVMKSNGTNAVASTITDDGTNVTMGAGLASNALNIGRDTTVVTAAQNGFRTTTFADGNNYLDSKTILGGSTIFRTGEGAAAGSTTTWLTLDSTAGATTWAALATMTAGVTTPANLTTTGTGDIVSGDTISSVNGATLGNTGTTNFIAGQTYFTAGGGGDTIINYAGGASSHYRVGNTTGIVYVGDSNTGGVQIGLATNATSVRGNTTLGSANTNTVTITGKINANVNYTGAAPTPSLCGTTPTMESGSNNRRGAIIIGLGATACTLTFSTAEPWAATPVCTLQFVFDSANTYLTIQTRSPTAFSFVPALTTAFDKASGTKVIYHCDGIL